MNTDHEIFKTEDIVLASALRCYGYKLASIERGRNTTKGIFVFENVAEHFIRDYDLGKITVEPVSFNNNIKQLTTSARRFTV